MKAYLSLFGLLVATTAFAQDGEERRTSKVQQRVISIKRELSGLADHRWAGEYYTGDGLGMNLRLYIAPNAGVAYQWHGCLGLYEQNLGSLDKGDTEIRVAWELENTLPLHDVTVYIPIRWGNETFLVAQHEILDFCIQARSTSPYFLSHTLRRTGGAKGKPSGKPELPQPYEKYRTLNHLAANIVQVDAQTSETMDGLVRVQQTVTIDAGKDVGLLPKMNLYTINRTRNTPRSLTVNSVDESKSTAVATVFRQRGELPVPLTAGSHLTTDWLATLASE